MARARQVLRSPVRLFAPSPPVVGLTYDDRRVVMARVDLGRLRVLAACKVELPAGAVVDGIVSVGHELARAVVLAAAGLEGPRRSAAPTVAVCHPGSGGGPWAGIGGHRPGEADAALRRAGLAPAAWLSVADVAHRVAQVALAAAPDERPSPLANGEATASTVAPQAVEAVATAGWHRAVVTLVEGQVEHRWDGLADYAESATLHWGGRAERPGDEIDPFDWPRKVRPAQPVALLAAGATLALTGR